MRLAILTAAACISQLVAVHGAEVTLRERAKATGRVVRLSDVAEVTSSLDESIDELAATPLMPAPAQGAILYLQSSQLRDLLAARGVNVRLVRILGANAVQIGDVTAMSEDHSSSAPHSADGTPLRQSLDEAVLAYVRGKSGRQDWKIEIAEEDRLAFADATRPESPIISGGKDPWTGYQRFRVSWPSEVRSMSVTVRIERVETVAIAQRAIERGDLIGAADVELRSHVGSVPAQVAVSLDMIVGQEAVQAIRPGAMVLTNQVRAPYVVRRGERVSIRARTSGVSVRTFATAEQDGSVGDLVMVQSLANKERYAARVSGVRELEVFTAGAVANDVAATGVRK